MWWYEYDIDRMDKPHVSVRMGKVTRYFRSIIHKGVDGETVLGSDLVTGIQGDRVTVSYRSGNTLYPCHRPVMGVTPRLTQSFVLTL